MSARVIPSSSYLEELEREFGGLRIPLYKFRRFFEEETRVFFDCEGGDPVACLDQILERSDLRGFVVLLLTKEGGKRKIGGFGYQLQKPWDRDSETFHESLSEHSRACCKIKPYAGWHGISTTNWIQL